ncbi:P pilus assembly/Cpx signaling pathway, periplasmic inhibitor/zinc-resistance associated protein [Brasilonema sp. UFV-L1]|uniref:P pilus assembly/Cpx signaling pathway, periplasmic inhibitor/zinc-resistance associated protein n=1 Tax=Brasilonema sp. UFV-L1 TaxID=2234130 RepID=UPI00145E6675|nr:P pilus assembly/Cpx signaling pathway, periplasmic inhibitor/zinc-resistance associated protein [Brasilonema sp. UFV-L1]NMG10570.1 P pilus assembly/Cpx signaling pathway, periplasmic inhibitor/zinc-resistance associated protein [Brasilonema sp. UFV-L1]
MKLKFFPILVVTLTSISIIATACQSPKAETPSSSEPNAQAQNVRMKDFPVPPGLELTQEQKTKLTEVQQSTRSKIESILTQEQKEQLKVAVEQNKDQRGVLQNLNLSSEQKTQIQEIMQSQREQLSNIFTSEQKQQLQQLRQEKPFPDAP